MIAATADNTPDTTNTEIVTRATGTPEYRAASALVPIAISHVPNTVLCSTNPSATAIPRNNTIGTGTCVPAMVTRSMPVNHTGIFNEWSPSNICANPRYNAIVANVTTSDGNPSRATTIPLTPPSTAPSSGARTTSGSSGHPTFTCNVATIVPTNASIDAHDKSMCPPTITNVIANAISPVSMYSELLTNKYAASKNLGTNPALTANAATKNPAVIHSGAAAQRGTILAAVDSVSLMLTPRPPHQIIHHHRHQNHHPIHRPLPRLRHIQHRQRHIDRPQQPA